MKKISILGSTGSIGTQTLQVIKQFPKKFDVVALSAGENINLLSEQIKQFMPQMVCVKDNNYAGKLKKKLNGSKVEIIYGEEGYEQISVLTNSDIVVSAMVGYCGLKPTFHAIKNGIDVALANKESLVIAGEILVNESRKSGAKIIPVDSEHSAIFQALECSNRKFVKKLILTASGGPFRNTSKGNLKDVTVEDALNHPTWQMGKKITIDSATLMNKGFEVIEARWLFDIPVADIEVWIHPQSIVHSMVEYVDGSVISQLSIPDMKIPIAYALSYPERLPIGFKSVKPSDFSDLTFEKVDSKRFDALDLAYNAINEGGTMAAVLNAANEVAVNAFLNKIIGFDEITKYIRRVMRIHSNETVKSIKCIVEADNWARLTTENLISN